MVGLLVAAAHAELVAFPERLDGWERIVTGTGKVLAATELSAAIHEHRPDRIVVVGTAGSLADHRIATVLRPRWAEQTDSTDTAALVGPEWAPPLALDLDGGEDQIAIGTADRFVESAMQRGRIRAERPRVAIVDMESYAYALVARRHGIPITILKAVSDSADEHAGEDWPTVLEECSLALWLAFQGLG